MKKLTSGVLTGTLAAALAASLAQSPAQAAPADDVPPGAESTRAPAHRPDNRPGPLTQEQQELRAAAVQAVAQGEREPVRQADGGSVVVLGKDKRGRDKGEKKAVELFDNNKKANVLSILSEFGDQVDPTYGGDAGPRHNQIPKPDRSVDNSTTWEPDYDKDYYDELFNGRRESMRDFYLKASEGQYEVNGTVEGWTQVPYNDAYYGSNVNSREDNGGSWAFIDDTADSWYADKLAELGSKEAVDEYLTQFDKWDRYDQDGDANFNEADGYIDHFQAIHAGEGEEAGASPDAIWSHRWYVNANEFGETGPVVGGEPVLYGGAQVGDSSYYIGDYTVEPENGGLGVFVHEYGHDLGLPDFYDTSGGDNGTAFWTIMSSGSWLGHGERADDGIGTTPGGFGPDEKAFLGWLDYETVEPGQDGTFTLLPAAEEKRGRDRDDRRRDRDRDDDRRGRGTDTKAVKVVLPDKVTEDVYNQPFAGEYSWWSGRGDGLNVTMAREVPAADAVDVTTKAWYQIEAGYDYLYAEYSTDDGATWTKLEPAIDGSSDGWTDLSWSYSPEGAASLFRFRYQTDGGVNEAGAFLDEISITAGETTITDGAENGDNGWTVDGWERSTGTDVNVNEQYYWLENRQYEGYDRTLRTGPYNFSEGYSRPNWVEFFSYQPGMLVWYADKSQADNNTRVHPGYGQALPVDARPEPFTFPDGSKPGNRRQPYDATFGTDRIDALCLHKEVAPGESVEACQTDRSPIPTFDDSDVDRYWSADNPWSSSKVAGVGVTATVLKSRGDKLLVQVSNPAQSG